MSYVSLRTNVYKIYVFLKIIWFGLTRKHPCPRKEFTTSNNLKMFQNLNLTIPTDNIGRKMCYLIICLMHGIFFMKMLAL